MLCHYWDSAASEAQESNGPQHMKEGRSTLFSDDRRGQTCQQVLRLKRGPSKPQAADGRADAVQESLTWAVAPDTKKLQRLTGQ